MRQTTTFEQALERLGVSDLAASVFARLQSARDARDQEGLQAADADLKREAEAAYRRAALVAHPDRGGDSDRMVALNEAIAIVRSAKLRPLARRAQFAPAVVWFGFQPTAGSPTTSTVTWTARSF